MDWHPRPSDSWVSMVFRPFRAHQGVGRARRTTVTEYDGEEIVEQRSRQPRTNGITRRQFNHRALGVAISAVAGSGLAVGVRRARAQAKATGEVVVCTWGGSYTESQKKACFDPFEQETGIRVRVVGIPDLAKIQAMVQSHAVEWDLVDAEGQMMLRLAAQDMLERADFSIIPRADLMPSAVSEWGIGSVSYGYVLGWSTKKFAAKEPATWRDFCAPGAFPGRRAMYAQALPNLEFALVADGVPMDKLYPLDVDRAFRILERYKPLVNVWYKSGTQIPTLLRGEEVDLIAATAGRMIDLKKSGAPVNFTYNQGAWMQSFWVVPKALWPLPKRYGHVMAFSEDGKVLADLQDPTGAYPETTGLTETADRLYVQNLHLHVLGWRPR